MFKNDFFQSPGTKNEFHAKFKNENNSFSIILKSILAI